MKEAIINVNSGWTDMHPLLPNYLRLFEICCNVQKSKVVHVVHYIAIVVPSIVHLQEFKMSKRMPSLPTSDVNDVELNGQLAFEVCLQ